MWGSGGAEVGPKKKRERERDGYKHTDCLTQQFSLQELIPQINSHRSQMTMFKGIHCSTAGNSKGLETVNMGCLNYGVVMQWSSHNFNWKKEIQNTILQSYQMCFFKKEKLWILLYMHKVSLERHSVMNW